MPLALAMDKLTGVLNTEAIKGMLRERPEMLDRLRKPDSLVTLAKELGGLEDHEARYLEAIPPALQEGIRAAIAKAVSQSKPIHLQYSPGYDFSVQIWDYGTGLSVHLSGPYPPSYPRDGYVEPRP